MAELRVAPSAQGLRCCLFLLLCLLTLQARAFDVIDDRGVTIRLTRAPERVLTLLPSLTETVCELGRCDALVGVDDYSNWPESVRRVPHVGGVENANIEQIVALKPDLILAGSTSRAVARLEGLGFKVAGFEIKTLADVQRTLTQVGQLLERPAQAERLWARINAGIDEAARELPPALRGTKAYFEIDSGPYAASEISHIGELLARIGVANIVPGNLGSVPKLNPEFVVRADPQVIMVSDSAAEALKERPGWNRIRAVRQGRVCALTSAQGDVITRPGPRLAEAAGILLQCLRSPPKP